MTQRVVFLCGHESPYGMAHLLPLLASRLDVAAIVIADAHRWQGFLRSLRGKTYLRPVALTPREQIKAWVKGHLPESLLLRMRSAELPPDISQIATQYHIPLWTVHDVNEPGFIARLQRLAPDYLISAAYPQIFKAALLDVPKYGCINFHPSLLPRFRGAHPHFWAIATGATQTGLTAHFMTPDLDAGDIVAQRTIPIDGCYYSELYARILARTPDIVGDVEHFLVDGVGECRTQDHTQAILFREPRDVHKRIFWQQQSATQISNLIRTEQAFCYFERHRVRITQAHVTDSNRNLTNSVRVEPGTIVDFGHDALVVQALDGCVNIQQMRDGGRVYTYPGWVRARHVSIGEQFR